MKLPSRRTALRLSAALGVLALAAPATASAKSAALAVSCSSSSAPVFSRWADTTNYTLVPGGDLEAGATGWTLSGGAGVVAGGDPFTLGGKASTKALSLPAGSSALTADTCIAQDTPTFRLLARNDGAASSKLRVEVVYGPGADKVSRVVATITAGAAWAPTGKLSVQLQHAGAAATVQFRFTPLDATGRWQIDSVYLDPVLRR